MSETFILAICMLAIVVAIGVNFKWGINLGVIAMAMAFLIGCLLQGESASAIFGYWPDSLIFFMLASALFYGFARENGTLNAFGSKLLWKFRKAITALPWVFFLIAWIMGLLGAGPGTIVLLAPIAFAVCQQVGISPILMVFAVDTGYNCGTQNPWTGTGVVLYGLVEESGVAADVAFNTYIMSYATFLINKVLFLAVIFIIFSLVAKKRGAAKNRENLQVLKEKPAAYTAIQKKTLALILISFFLLVIPNVINTFVKIDNEMFKNLVKLCKPQAILVIFALVASVMNLADSKKVIQKLPMGTVLTIAGVCFLMEIAKKAGLMEAVVGMFHSDSMPRGMVTPIFCLLAAFLSIFASGTSVVLPLLFPMVPALSAALGINPVALYTAAQMGALATPISPFSTAGAQFVSLAPEELSDKLIKQQFIMALVMMVATTAAAMLGLCGIFKV